MPAPGTVWAGNSWDVDAWQAHTWQDSIAPVETPPNEFGSVYMTRARRRRHGLMMLIAWLFPPVFA